MGSNLCVITSWLRESLCVCMCVYLCMIWVMMIMVIMIQSVDAELRSCMKVEMAVLVTDSPYGLCGRKAALQEEEVPVSPNHL